MRIAIDCRMLGSGGIGTYLASLLPFFTAENSCVLLGEPETLAAFPCAGNAEIVPCRIRPFSAHDLLFFPKELARKINSCDAFYSPYCNIPAGIRIPVYATIHDVVFLDVPGLASKAGTLARRLVYKYAAARARVIFTVSEFSAGRIRERVCRRKPVVVTYEAAPPWLSRKKGEKTERNGAILFVGNIKRHKGLGVLLEAFRKARRRGLSQRLLIAGNAENFRTADDDARGLAAESDGVEFTGRISDDALRQLYMRSDFLVQPSFYEGFGLPPLEAMTLGTRAVVSDIPVFREVYGDFPVLFFRAGDADDLSEKLIEAARLVGEKFLMPERYSFDRTYAVIRKTMEETV